MQVVTEQVMEPLPPQNVQVTSGLWGRWLEVNRRRAIFHRWEQLEASGCIDNFRIAAGEKEGFRQGWFFADSDAYKWNDGHEEVEIALLRLYEVTGHPPYLDLARQLVEKRGRIPHFWLSPLRQNASMQARRRAVEQQRAAYRAAHPEYTPPPLPPENFAPRPPFSRLRWYLGALSGKYFQQHVPIRQWSDGHGTRSPVVPPISRGRWPGWASTSVAGTPMPSGSTSTSPGG